MPRDGYSNKIRPTRAGRGPAPGSRRPLQQIRLPAHQVMRVRHRLLLIDHAENAQIRRIKCCR
jgi:hypothetical protein